MPRWPTCWTASASCSTSCHRRSANTSASSCVSCCRHSNPDPVPALAPSALRHRSADDLGDRKPFTLEALTFVHDGSQRSVERQNRGMVGRLGGHLDVEPVLLGGELGQLAVDPVHILLGLT